MTVDFQGQGYLSEFFQYFIRIQSIKLPRKILKSSLLLEMKFDLEIPIFKVNNVSRIFKTIYTYSKHQILPKNIKYFVALEWSIYRPPPQLKG